MKIKRIAHLGIAVKDLDAPKKLYTDNLGLKLAGEEVVEAQKVKVSFIQVGESNLELLLPTQPDSPVGKFLENKGEGFHHLALEVEDIHAGGGGTEGRGGEAHRRETPGRRPRRPGGLHPPQGHLRPAGGVVPISPLRGLKTLSGRTCVCAPSGRTPRSAPTTSSLRLQPPWPSPPRP